MSLGRLLTAGKSFIGMRDTTSRYRMRTENLLPKFESPKNPFASLPKTEPLKPESGEPSVAPPEPRPELVTEPTKMETSSLFETKPREPAKASLVKEAKPLPVERVKPEPKAAHPLKTVPARKWILPSGWVKKLNPLSYLPIWQPRVKPAKGKGARSVVQAELSLEKVTVVRNDLNDADLEVIPVKPAAPPREEMTHLPPAPKSRPGSWGRSTSRALGEEQAVIR